MPYIDTSPQNAAIKITEENIQNNLADLLIAQGWTTVCNFKKVAYDRQMINPQSQLLDISTYSIAVAEHFIYKNAKGNMFGLAIVGQWEQMYSLIASKPRTDGEVAFGTWATNQFRKFRSPQTLYFYMIEKTDGLESQTADIVLAWDKNDLLRACLDVEVASSHYVVNNGSAQFEIANATPTRMQSPLVAAGLRTDLLEQYYDDSYHSAVQYTNWWPDSEISIKGWIDTNNIFVVIQADTVPAPEGNLVPSIPFYFGQIDSEEAADEAYALFTGSIPKPDNLTGALDSKLNTIAQYDYDDPTKVNIQINPILKNYPKNPSNGVDNVMVSRSRLGARYQQYFLSWDAPANAMPPERSQTIKKKDYPRAWGNAENPLYKYNFSPSRYDSKVHTSRIYLVHPEEGVRGALKNSIALPAINVSAQKLRVRKASCPDDQFDLYRYFLVDGVSPLTKVPATQFRSAGIGIFTGVVDKDGKPIS
jgi:hypothetical protein